MNKSNQQIGSGGRENIPPEKPSDSNNLKYLLAVACFVIYIVVIIVMAMNVNVEETTWGRYTYLFQGIEAIVLAAVGWIFGKEVHRQQAKNAETRADAAQKEATAKEGELTKVKTNLSDLNKYIKTHAPNEDYQMSDIAEVRTGSAVTGTEKQLQQSIKADWSKLTKYADSLALND